MTDPTNPQFSFLDEPPPAAAAGRPSLAKRFLTVPFTVLDARTGWWQGRKADWLRLGLRSDVGRDEQLLFSASSQPPDVYEAKTEYQVRVGREVSWAEFIEANPGVARQPGTSIFDPVLCELVYRWFCPVDGQILDPFAGGSVRGVVAALCGRRYAGVDLRAEQIDANRAQWAEIGQPGDTAPVWRCGDSRGIATLCTGLAADLVFSCPPYADLEVYSDDPADLSTMDYPQFLAVYREIIASAVGMLRPDRFACFVVGDVRDRRGFYREFVSDTIAAFRDAGARLYNEAILVTPVGSLAMRAGKQFEISRKLGKAHQNVLVFVKGDPRKATAACGPVG
jgi:DNA modification methylase